MGHFDRQTGMNCCWGQNLTNMCTNVDLDVHYVGGDVKQVGMVFATVKPTTSHIDGVGETAYTVLQDVQSSSNDLAPLKVTGRYASH